MSAADSLEQSAKRVVTSSGLIGLSAAVFQTQRKADIIKWLRGQKRIYIDPMRIPKQLLEGSPTGGDAWDAMQYSLIMKNHKID